jgi:glycosyltransferase 2 family protein
MMGFMKQEKGWGSLLRWGKWACLALVFCGMAFYVDFKSVWRAIDANFFLAIAFSQIPIWLGLLLAVIRHSMLMGQHRLLVSVSFKAMLIAASLNYMLPSRLGELIKATYIKQRQGIPLRVGLSAVLTERVGDLLVLSMFGLYASTRSGYGHLLVPFLALFGLSVGLFFWGALIFRALRKGGRRIVGKKYMAILMQFERGMRQVAGRRNRIPVLMLGLAIWGAYVLSVGLVVHLVSEVPIEHYQILLLFVAMAFGSAIPLTPGGVGISDGVGVFLLMQYGASLDNAVVTMAGIRLANVIFIVPASMGLILKSNLGVASLVSQMKSGGFTSGG